MLNAAFGQCGKHSFVLPPFLPQSFLPVGVGFDAVSVTNMHRRCARQALRCTLQGFNAPICGVLHVDVEGRLIKLNDVNTVCLQGQRFLVEKFGKRKRHLHLVAVEAVCHRVHNGHGARQSEFEFFPGVGAGQLRLKSMYSAFEFEGRYHLRHLGVVAVVANAHGDFVLKVDAVHLLQKAVNEMLTRLLAVTHDVKTRVFLRLDPQQRGVRLGLAQFVTLRLPLRPELLGLRQPGGFGQAASNGGFKQCVHQESPLPFWL